VVDASGPEPIISFHRTTARATAHSQAGGASRDDEAVYAVWPVATSGGREGLADFVGFFAGRGFWLVLGLVFVGWPGGPSFSFCLVGWLAWVLANITRMVILLYLSHPFGA